MASHSKSIGKRRAARRHHHDVMKPGQKGHRPHQTDSDYPLVHRVLRTLPGKGFNADQFIIKGLLAGEAHRNGCQRDVVKVDLALIRNIDTSRAKRMILHDRIHML